MPVAFLISPAAWPWWGWVVCGFFFGLMALGVFKVASNISGILPRTFILFAAWLLVLAWAFFLAVGLVLFFESVWHGS
jgi:hypothetical protein